MANKSKLAQAIDNDFFIDNEPVKRSEEQKQERKPQETAKINDLGAIKKHNYPNTREKKKTRVISFKVTETEYLKVVNGFNKSGCKSMSEYILKRLSK